MTTHTQELSLNEMRAAFMAASTDISREVLNHISVELEVGKHPIVVATDGRALVAIESRGRVCSTSGGFLIPYKMMSLMDRISRSDRMIQHTVSDGRLAMSSQDYMISCLAPTGIYPKWRQVLPMAESKPIQVMSVNSEIIRKLADVAKAVTFGQKKPSSSMIGHVMLYAHGDITDPISVKFSHVPNVHAVVMPVRCEVNDLSFSLPKFLL